MRSFIARRWGRGPSKSSMGLACAEWWVRTELGDLTALDNDI